MFNQALVDPLVWLGLTVGVGCLSAGALAVPPTTQGVAAPKLWSFAATPQMGWNSYDCWGTSVDGRGTGRQALGARFVAAEGPGRVRRFDIAPGAGARRGSGDAEGVGSLIATPQPHAPSSRL